MSTVITIFAIIGIITTASVLSAWLGSLINPEGYGY